MKIVGGIYGEHCVLPDWNQVFGSGGRAAAALANWCPGLELLGYADAASSQDIWATMSAFGVDVHLVESPELLQFSYFHPLSNPDINPPPHLATPLPSIQVEGDLVLRFGMLEGEAQVFAKTAVYDPQTGICPERFRANGSHADRLAIVLNQVELERLTEGENPANAPVRLLSEEKAEVLILKSGVHGASVWTRDGMVGSVPAYRSTRIFKIGSGDVFSAAFAWVWGYEGRDPLEAADLASRAVAHYCNTQQLPIPDVRELAGLSPLPTGKTPGRIYLAGPFFDIGQRWVVEEALECLERLGATVFSPYHNVGLGGTDNALAQADLRGLESCDAVFAILNGSDPGTIFEVGYARDRGMPVVALAEDIYTRDLTMMAGSGCEIVDDFASAIYRALWASMK